MKTIAEFVAVILVAAAATATASTMRSPAPAAAPTGSLVLKELVVDVNKLPIEDFDDMSLVYSTGTKH